MKTEWKFLDELTLCATLLRHLLTIASSFLLSLILFGQSKSFITPKYLNGKPILKDSLIYVSDKELRVFDLTDGSDSFHIRFSTETEALDIWTYDYQRFYGKILLFLKTHEIKPDRYYNRLIPIDTTTAKKIYNVFKEYSILDIPTEDSIKGWLPVLDGDLYKIEYSKPRIYRFKQYWTPSELDTTREAKAISALLTHLPEIINMHVWQNNFVCNLPPGLYECGNLLLRCSKKHR